MMSSGLAPNSRFWVAGPDEAERRLLCVPGKSSGVRKTPDFPLKSGGGSGRRDSNPRQAAWYTSPVDGLSWRGLPARQDSVTGAGPNSLAQGVSIVIVVCRLTTSGPNHGRVGLSRGSTDLARMGHRAAALRARESRKMARVTVAKRADNHGQQRTGGDRNRVRTRHHGPPWIAADGRNRTSKPPGRGCPAPHECVPRELDG